MEDDETGTIRALHRERWARRLLSPAEAINALTVGAANSDQSADVDASNSYTVIPITTSGMPSPISALGLGIARSVKPDVLFAGGRGVYQSIPSRDRRILRPLKDSLRAGVKVACPGPAPGGLRRTGLVAGTSCAAAQATHGAALLMDALREIPEQPELLDREAFMHVILKALLVHSARWRDARSALARCLAEEEIDQRPGEVVAAYLGFGSVPLLDTECSPDSITLIGWGSISHDETHSFEILLPTLLNGIEATRELAITLAYCSETTSRHAEYNATSIWFDVDTSSLGVESREVGSQLCRRGTVQHQVFTGRKRVEIGEDAILPVAVSCKATRLYENAQLPYALAVTLRVKGDVTVAIYNAVRARIRPRVRIPA